MKGPKASHIGAIYLNVTSEGEVIMSAVSGSSISIVYKSILLLKFITIFTHRIATFDPLEAPTAQKLVRNIDVLRAEVLAHILAQRIIFTRGVEPTI